MNRQLKLYILAGLIVVSIFAACGIIAAATEPPTIVSLKNVDGTIIKSGTVGTAVYLYGSGFYTTSKNISVKFGSVETPAKIESGILVSATVPNLAPGKYYITVTTDYGVSNPVAFTMETPAKVSSINPNYGKVGYTIILTGQYLNLGGKPTIKFGSVTAPSTTVYYVTSTKLYVKVPAVDVGVVDVTVNNGFGDSNSVPFKVVP